MILDVLYYGLMRSILSGKIRQKSGWLILRVDEWIDAKKALFSDDLISSLWHMGLEPIKKIAFQKIKRL